MKKTASEILGEGFRVTVGHGESEIVVTRAEALSAMRAFALQEIKSALLQALLNGVEPATAIKIPTSELVQSIIKADINGVDITTPVVHHPEIKAVLGSIRKDYNGISPETLRDFYGGEVVDGAWLAPLVQEKKKISLWLEGHVVTGNSAPAMHLGDYEALNLLDALTQYRDSLPDDKAKSYVRLETLSIWGCRVFDNEADARKSFG